MQPKVVLGDEVEPERGEGQKPPMLVILDDGPRRVFCKPLAVIAADTPDQVPAALAAVQTALDQGHHVAGWLGYELGYALEPRLARQQMPEPLLRLGVFGPPSGEAAPAFGRAYAGPLRPEWSETDYESRFSRVKDFIAAGDIYQANLSFRARFAFAGDPRAFYEQLLPQSGAAHCAYVDTNAEEGGPRILSFSPELFFDLSGDGHITVRPMKGTFARKGDDEAERAALAASEKDRAENLIDGADVRVVERRSRLRLALELPERDGVGSECVGDELECDRSSQAGVAGFIDDAHSPGAQELHDVISGNRPADHARCRLMLHHALACPFQCQILRIVTRSVS